MKPPRKPRSGPRPPQRRSTPLSRTEQARRIADSWGVSTESNAPSRKETASRKKAAAASGADKGKSPARDTPTAGRPSFPNSPSAKAGPGRESRAPSLRRDADRTRPEGNSIHKDAPKNMGRRPAPTRPVRAPGPNGERRNGPPAPSSARSKAAGEPQRIAKLLARAGIASRREIERMIAEGRIALDDVVLETPATVLPSLSGVTVDGQPVAEAEAPRLFLFHKPTGCLTTERDPAGRPTIYDRLPQDLPRLMPVGRLDMTTEGLLLLTNDGELKRRLELPSSGVERTYRARAFGEISQAELERLIEGIEIDGIRYGRIDANLERRTGRNQWIEMTLTEGKNREVRRVLEHLGLKVNRLLRTRYGPFELGDSAPGALLEIRRGEMDRFLYQLKNPGGEKPQ